MVKIFSSIKQRIVEYLDYRGITKEDFYSKTEISPSNFKGNAAKSELGGDKIAKILTCYPDINAEWLLTGKGEMLSEQKSRTDLSRFTPLEISEYIANNEDIFLRDKTFRLIVKALHYESEVATLEQKINDLENRGEE